MEAAMFSVYTVDMQTDSRTRVAEFDTYDEAVEYANSIATGPDPNGVYVLICYGDYYDSPRYTS